LNAYNKKLLKLSLLVFFYIKKKFSVNCIIYYNIYMSDKLIYSMRYFNYN